MKVSNKQHVVAALSLLILGSPLVPAQTTVTNSEVMGFSTVPLPAGGRVMAPVFVNSHSYASIATVSGNTLSATNLASNAFAQVSVNGSSYPSCYVEITDTNTFGGASYLGQTFDVSTNTSNSITVSGLPSALNGQQVAIAVRAHITLGEVAAASSGLSDLSSAITLYGPSNSISSYYYDSGGVVAGDFSTPCNGIPVYPCSGVVVNNQSNATVLYSGEVKSTPTVVPIFAGVNILAPLNPQGGENITTLGLAPALAPYSDTLSIVADDGGMAVSSFYSDGTNLLDGNYAPLASSNAPSLSAGNGFLINATSSGTWTNTTVVGN